MSDFTTLLELAREDSRVLGVIVGGSRGKGFQTDRSDWDTYLIVADDVDPHELVASLPAFPPEIQICAVMTLKEFAAHAEVGDPDEWNRYNFAHVVPAFDRTDGEVARLCAAKEWLPEDLARERASTWLDAYVNSHYRALKNPSEDRNDASTLDAAEAASHLLEFVFAAERRARPYNKYLDWELQIHSLDRPWWPTASPLRQLVMATRGDVSARTAMFTQIEMEARRAGFADLLDSWGEPSLAIMRRGNA